jgi:hypothetical protein
MGVHVHLKEGAESATDKDNMKAKGTRNRSGETGVVAGEAGEAVGDAMV